MSLAADFFVFGTIQHLNMWLYAAPAGAHGQSSGWAKTKPFSELAAFLLLASLAFSAASLLAFSAALVLARSFFCFIASL